MSNRKLYGKYTEEEFANVILKRMSHSEQDKIRKGLDFLELKLQDLIFPKSLTDTKNKNNNIDVPTVNNNFFLKRLDDKRAQIANNEEGKIYNDFKDLIPNIFNELTKFGEEAGEREKLVSSYESVFKIVPAIRSRYGKEIKSETEDVLTNFKNEQQRLKEENENLKWNGDQRILFKISNFLFENETTNNKNAFANAINTGELCSINSKRMVFFVMLFYKLVEKPSPMIVTDKASGNGAIGVASRFFCHNGKTHNRNISMIDRMKRINAKLLKNDEILKKTQETVETFIKKF